MIPKHNSIFRALFLALLTAFLLPLGAQGNLCFLTNAGMLTAADGSTIIRVCLDDMDEGLTDIVSTGFMGGTSRYFVTTPGGDILEILEGNPPFDLRSYGAQSIAITRIAYTGNLSNFELDQNICTITSDDCISFSNPLIINRQEGDGCNIFCDAEAGMLQLTEGGGTSTERCIIDGVADPVAVSLTGTPAGDSMTYVITTDEGVILAIPAGDGPFDLSGAGVGTCLIYYLSYDSGLTGLAVGNTADDFDGCFSFSNPITVVRNAIGRGVLALADGGGTEITICAGDGISDAFNVTLTDTSGANFTYVITDGMGVVLGLPTDQPFDLEGAGGGNCVLYALTYADNFGGINPGDNLDELTGCFALSNPITVTRNTGNDCEDFAFQANLSGLNEVPCPVTSTGSGMVTATLTGRTLTVSGSFSDLSSDFNPNVAGGAHLHLGMAGLGGGIIFRLTSELDADLRGGTFPPASNQFELTDEQIVQLRARGIYVNIHTVDFGSGEIRGQLVPSGADDYMAAYLLGVNEVPSVVTPAGGAAIVEREGNQITVSGGFSGLTGPIATQIAGGAHLHIGIAGRNGAVVFPLNMEINDDMTGATFMADSNVFILTDDQLAALDNDMFYVNVHSAAVMSGEIRGQVMDLSVTQFYANPAGHQARPVAINTPGSGRALINYDGDTTITVSGSVGNLLDTIRTDIAGGAHLHLGLAGSSGPVSFPLTFTLDDDGLGGMLLASENTFTVTAEQVASFYDRGYYLNVHTAAEASGEIRGQVMNLAKGYFGSNLAGINANPDAVKTTGNGFMMYELCGTGFVATGSFNGLSSDFAANIAGGSHIHAADAAGTGGIVFGLNVGIADDLRSGSYLGSNNRFTIDSAGTAALTSGGYYFNLHTTAFGSGEIRGQLLRDDDAFPTAPEIITPEDGAIVTVFEGGSDLEDGIFTAADDPNGDLLVYTIEIVAPNDTFFTNIIACEKVGTDTLSNASINAVYDTLIAFGAMPGMSVPLRYRVVASDGSVSTPGGSRTITLVISDPPCNATAGSLALENGATEFTICAGDGIADPFNVVLTDTVGTDSFTYLVVSDAGVILGVPANQPFDFDGAGGGACTLYAVSHDGSLTGAMAGAAFSDLGGCFALSNPIVVTRNTGADCTSFTYQANLSGLNESSCPVTSTGSGMVTATLTGSTLTVSGTFANLSSDFNANVAGGAHLHLGMAGSGGGIAFRLTSTVDADLRAGSFAEADNRFILTDEQIELLEQRGFYVNIHTVDFGSGEIRGQLVPAGADAYKVAYLLGVNEVPSIVTPAGGAVIVERTGSSITVSGSFSGLTGTIATQIAGGAHLHIGIAGRNGSVVFPLNMEINDDMTGATFMADSNVFTLTADQLTALDNDMFYVNVHSSTFPGGELRGQVLDMSVTQFYANPAGHQARPMAINTPGAGRALISYDGETTITVTGSVTNLLDTIRTDIAGGAHLHLGLAGSSGPVSFPLTFTLDDDGRGGMLLASDNTFTVTPEQVASFYDRGYYLNVHTAAEASGEIRGQVMNLAKGYFGSNLAGINANPDAVKTTGNGFMMYELCATGFVATGSFNNLSSDFAANIAGGSHIHAADAAGTGGIVFGLNVNIADDLRSGSYLGSANRFSIDSAGTAALTSGGYYFNLHTTSFGSGEIRGQLLRDDNAFPTAAEIITPEDGAIVTVFEGGSDLEDGIFAAAHDANGDLLVYTIEITSPGDTSFASIIACEKVGTDTLSDASIDAVYDTLIAFGAIPGLAVPLRYRVVASDGSVSTPGGSRTITLVIGEDSCNVTAGNLTLAEGGTEMTICAGDSIADPFNVVLTDTAGTNAFTYLVVSDQGEILGVPANQPFDFDGAGGGACTLYAVSHDGTLTGATAGAAFADLGGCFALSNPIVVTRLTGDDCTNGLVTINEVDQNGMVELINLSNTSVNVSSIYLASNDEVVRIGTLSIECGSYFLKPNDQVTLNMSGILDAAGDELALLTNESYTSASSVLSYLAWGDSERRGEDFAVTTGLWTAGSNPGTPDNNVSIQRIPALAQPTFALGVPTPCAPNQLTTSTVQPAVERMAVFPNPFTERLTLEVSGIRSRDTNVQLFDLNGRLIISRSMELTDGRFELGTGQLTAGAYLLRLTNSSGTSAMRIIKQ